MDDTTTCIWSNEVTSKYSEATIFLSVNEEIENRDILSSKESASFEFL